MSLHMIFTILQLLPLRTPSLQEAVDSSAEEGWTYWLYLLSSKGIYSVLVSLILFCCLINAIQNKFGKKDDHVSMKIDFSNWVDTFWNNISGFKLIPCGPLKAHGYPSCGFNTFDFEDEIMGNQCLFDKMIVAEGELEALRNAVDIARKMGSDLEGDLEEAEKEKDDIEGRSLVEKQWRQTELDTAMSDMQSLQEQLHILKLEKEEVILKCQGLQDEAQKAGDALQKRQQIQERLDEALTVVSILKKAVADLEADRDEALISLGCVLPDLPVTEESREKLSKLVFKNIQNNESSLTRSLCVEDLHLLGRGDDTATCNRMTPAQHWVDNGEQGYGETMSCSFDGAGLHSDSPNETPTEGSSENTEDDLVEFEYNLDGDKDKLDEELDEEQIEMSRSVQLSSSAAFRQFCQSAFGQN